MPPRPPSPWQQTPQPQATQQPWQPQPQAPQQSWQPNPPQQPWQPVPPPQTAWSPNASQPNPGQYVASTYLTGAGPRRPNRLSQFIAVIALGLMAFSGGLVVDHYAFPGASPAAGPTAGSSSNVSPQDSALYGEALQIIRKNFVGRSTLTDKQLLYGSIKGLVDSLGDTGHTIFMTPDEYKQFQDSLNAEVAGIGVWLSDTGGVFKIDRVMDGAPAALAGIKAGDQITAIDGATTDTMTRDDVSSKIRGAVGTSVKITVIHMGTTAPVTITVTRANISIPLVEWTVVPGTHIADIELLEFSDGASDQVKAAITSATSAGATSIILDLRGNPGGYAQEATDVASQFLSTGTIYYSVDANGKKTSIDVNTSLTHTDLPMVVLVDHDSASSSEIVAGALQDYGRAKIVGTATYGTGTVLQKFTLSDGSVILLGTAYWTTPQGHKIFGVGITPDEKVILPITAVPLDPVTLSKMTPAQVTAATDTELQAAIKDLSK